MSPSRFPAILLMGFFLLVAAALPAQPTNGLLAHYAFEGNADDSSGRGFHGKLSSGASFSAGRFGRGLALSGEDSYVEIADPQGVLNFDARTESYTVALWVRVDGEPVGGTGERDATLIIDHGTTQDGPISYALHWRFATGRFLAHVWGGHGSGGNVVVASETQPILGQWYHVALVMDQRQLRLFVNGREEIGPKQYHYDNSVISPDYTSTKNWEGVRNIGRYAGRTIGQTFPGAIDDVRIYNRALASSEIAGIAGADQGTFSKIATLLAPSGAAYDLFAKPFSGVSAYLRNQLIPSDFHYITDSRVSG